MCNLSQNWFWNVKVFWNVFDLIKYKTPLSLTKKHKSNHPYSPKYIYLVFLAEPAAVWIAHLIFSIHSSSEFTQHWKLMANILENLKLLHFFRLTFDYLLWIWKFPLASMGVFDTSRIFWGDGEGNLFKKITPWGEKGVAHFCFTSNLICFVS